MDKSMTNNDNIPIILQATSFAGAIVTAVTPIVSLMFMIVSIVSGCILIYKFFAKQK
jgi:hypothetical protein